jgi:predicted transcriptional regulator of viral defense system
MEKWSLYKIREKAINTGRSVFSIVELANLISKKKSIATVYASRLVEKGLAKKLLNGKISFDQDDFVIASQLIEPSYITAASALNLYGLIQQVPSKIECVTTKRSIEYKKFGINYHKIQNSLFYGYKRKNKSGSYIMLAEPEKALIDGIYLNILPKTIVKEIINDLDIKKLNDYKKRFNGRGKKKILEMIKC